MKIDLRLKSHCRVCNHETNHVVKAIETTSDSNEEFSYSEDFAIVQCLGCDSFSFRKEYNDSESYYNDESTEGGSVINVYPPIAKGHKLLEDQWRLPELIGLMYNESIEALSSGCKVLAGVGFRTIIEAVCLDKGIKGETLEDKINNLASNKFITPGEKDRLHSIRFLGNDSVHEIETPTQEQLDLALYIIEHLLNNIYLLDIRVRTKLKSVVKNYTEFKRLLTQFIRDFTPGEEHSLFKLFGKDVRRIKEHGATFEAQLIEEIKSGAFTLLSLVPIEDALELTEIAEEIDVYKPVKGSKITKPKSPRFKIN
jgi:hypothetical protein